MVRVKRRYLVLHLEFAEKNLLAKNKYYIGEDILNKVRELYGEFGLGAVKNAFQIKYGNRKTGIYYVRVDRNAADMLASCLPLINKVEREPATLSCIFTAATIRHANIFLKKYNEKALREEPKTPQRRKLNLQQKILKKRKKRV